MRNPISGPATISVLILAGVLTLGATIAQAQDATSASDGESGIEQGKALAFDRKKGNCLACHMIEGGNLPGNIGPPLFAMKARFPDKAKLYAQIADPTERNPNTVMPPFKAYGVLSDEELEKITEFIYSL